MTNNLAGPTKEQLFKAQLRAAAEKLRRSVEDDDGVDPQSGFTKEDICVFIMRLPSSDGQKIQANAVLRRNDCLAN